MAFEGRGYTQVGSDLWQAKLLLRESSKSDQPYSVAKHQLPIKMFYLSATCTWHPTVVWIWVKFLTPQGKKIVACVYKMGVYIHDCIQCMLSSGSLTQSFSLSEGSPCLTWLYHLPSNTVNREIFVLKIFCVVNFALNYFRRRRPLTVYVNIMR